MKYIAQQNQISAWLAKLAEQYKILAPKHILKSVTFQEYTVDEIQNTDLNELLSYTTTSAKKAYIPATEELFSYKCTKRDEDLSKSDTVLNCDIKAEPTILFGMRPCDTKGVEVLDAAYLKGKYCDPYYAARRGNNIIISQTCAEALPICFCNWTDTDLTKPYVSDILFTQVENNFIFEAHTDTGKKLLENSAFEKASKENISSVEKIYAKAYESLSEKPDLSKLPQIFAYNFENKEYWSTVTAGCIGCNSCTFTCPICQCFTITDEGTPLEGKRIRSWASCMTDEFTNEASGHNPRSAELMRWRNRLGHKFSYMTAWHKDLFSCTGCGRCLTACPASISIKGMVAKMLEITPADADLPLAVIHYKAGESPSPKNLICEESSVKSVNKEVVKETKTVKEKAKTSSITKTKSPAKSSKKKEK